jgi:hypothetical protein
MINKVTGEGRGVCKMNLAQMALVRSLDLEKLMNGTKFGVKL